MRHCSSWLQVFAPALRFKSHVHRPRYELSLWPHITPVVTPFYQPDRIDSLFASGGFIQRFESWEYQDL